MLATEFSFLFCSVLCLISCRTAYYTPNTVNTPVLREKFDSEVSASALYAIDGLSSNNALNFVSTISPVKYVALMTNCSYYSDVKSDGRHRCRYLDLGIGGYYPLVLNRLQPDEMLIALSAYSGVSFGDIRHTSNANSYTNVKFNKYFLQVSAVFVESIRSKFSFRFGAGFRLNQMVFYQGMLFGSGISPEYLRVFQSIDNLGTLTTNEVTVNIGANIGPYHCLLGLNSGLNQRFTDLNFNQHNLGISIGFDIQQLYAYLAK